jgi:hypothetical protein
MSGFKPFQLKVRDTGKILFEGEADRVTSYNDAGPFDIYPMHANFISIAKKGLSIYLKHKLLQQVKFSHAVIKVKKDLVHIYLGIEELMLEEETTSKKIETI